MSTALALIRGAAIGSVFGVVVFAVSMVLGVASGASDLVFFGGAAAGVVVGLTDRGERKVEALGSVLVVAGAVVVGAATGFGWLEYSVVAGGALGAVWAASGEVRPRMAGHWAAWGGALLLLLVLILLPLVIDGGTLGHDESAYAVKAREWLEGTPGTGWFWHRGVAMSIYGYVVLWLGGSESWLRMIGLMGAVGLIWGVWALGRQLSSSLAGLFAASGMIAGPAFLYRSTEYLSDVPSTALLVFCMVIVWGEFNDRDLPSYRLLWVAPLGLAAFYFRYQSSLSLALIGLVTLLLWWPKVRRRPGPLLWLIAIGALGLTPHFLLANESTGNPLGIVLGMSRLAGRAYLGSGLVDYGQQLPWRLAGFAGPIALVASITGLVLGWRDRGMRRTYLFLMVPAFAQVIALGVVSHGEPRFLFFPIALVMVAGAICIEHWVIPSDRRWARAVTWGLAIVIVGSLALSVHGARRSVANRVASNEPVELAAEAISGEVGDESCGVMTSYDPQITFYSACATEVFHTNLEPADAAAKLSGDLNFLVLIEGGKRQPAGEDLEGLIALTEPPPLLIDGVRRDATVYAFAD